MTEKHEKVILIIDDDVDFSLFLENEIRHTKYKVICFNNAVEALNYLENGVCDIVLVDIFLPDLDGVEVAHRIRIMKGKYFPVIGITCVPFNELKTQFPNALYIFTEVCIKPFGFQTVMEFLKTDGPHHSHHKMMNNLITNYHATISDRIELLRGLIYEYEKTQSIKNLSELRVQIHKLSGHAGLYGYNEVGEICKTFDKELGDDISIFHEAVDNLSDWIKRYYDYLERIKKAFTVSGEYEKGLLENKIINKKAVIGVIGLGNIGLALLDAFGKVGFQLVGYDINEHKTKMLQNQESYLNYMDMSHLFKMIEKQHFKPSSDPEVLREADVIIISVPTSIDRYGTPNLNNLQAAFQTTAKYLSKYQLIILQSSTYPGTTEEQFLPLLLKSNLKVGIDFYLAHVPEIADIGNTEFNFIQIPRIVSGITPACLQHVSLLYENISSKIVPCSSTRIAESAKLLQNSFRLVNISFINEMKVLFDTMNIDIWEVITAAASKPFGFMPFYPSPGIGGDCIPIAPFYLVWRAKSTGGPTSMIEDAGRINNLMAQYVINKLINGLNLGKKTIRDAKILVLGVAYKRDVNDIRESPALKILPLLKGMLAKVDYHDPYIKKISNFHDHPELYFESVELNNVKLHEYDAVIVLTDHHTYNWDEIVKYSRLVIDTRNISAKVIDKRKIIKA